ncbi:hypothetical protein KRX57_10605 [Weeksellaceae bacterium TAE3-ERU29]|nr:hypothetical protein [Weeksellaceae bacterium TAE3-ERU29]
MKKQIYKLSTMFFLGLGAIAFGQQTGSVGINVEVPAATLDIQPNSDNAAISATTNEGILVPKLSKERVANIADGSLVEGTMVYVDGISYSGSNNKVSGINANGFYYYDGNLWVKVGSKGATLNAITGGIREVAQANAEQWKVPGTFCLIQTTDATINMPDPSEYVGKILSVNNQSRTQLNYGGDYTPVSASTLQGGKGHLLMSNGSAWYIIGGSY